MDIRVVAMILLFVLGGSMLGAYAILGSEDNDKGVGIEDELKDDPLMQGEGHDHRDPAQHNMSSSNIVGIEYNELTSPGNAEVQVMTAPDGRTYAYQAGWNDVHITDVTLSLIHI